MRTTTCFTAFALAAALMATPLRADISTSRPVTPGDTSLQDVFDSVSSPPIDAIDDQFDRAVFTNSGSGGMIVTYVAKATGPSKKSRFGIYNFLDPSIRAVIFDSDSGITGSVSDSSLVSFMKNGDVAVTTATSSAVTPGFGSHKFGFFIDVLDENDLVLETLFSEDSRNGGDASALIFQGDDATGFQPPGRAAGPLSPADFVIAFDDGRQNGAAGDRSDDFVDLVVIAESIVPIPEPSSIVLAAICLVALLGIPVRRRR